MSITTVNPFTGKELAKYQEDKPEKIAKIFKEVNSAQVAWGKDLDVRLEYMKRQLKPSLQKNLESLALVMSSEMGKTISQSKCRATFKNTAF
jgi:acyl-CoA reductase-like NAD-dependent aldehyde dehydrogenase